VAGAVLAVGDRVVGELVHPEAAPHGERADAGLDDADLLHVGGDLADGGGHPVGVAEHVLGQLGVDQGDDRLLAGVLAVDELVPQRHTDHVCPGQEGVLLRVLKLGQVAEVGGDDLLRQHVRPLLRPGPLPGARVVQNNAAALGPISARHDGSVSY
jgi:hypothetical protein